ncbi:MAG TPA: LysR family transcriptional regulator [Candidatus Lustribacter sp.]|jgi:DNA-binding transcriptional LysR family regulator|nr:LysR family transcriptional regulator [Candidatus Lustribacter sp.]
MELRQLRYFVEIAEQGSFTKAAETLSIAQPALTTQIQKLEAEFNAQLFIRTTRGIVLTEVGRVVEEQARRALDAADATKRSAQLAGEVASARLAVGFTRIFPFIPIAQTVRRVRRERPNIKIELHEMWSGDQMDALISGALDVGFVHYTTGDEDRDLAIVPIAEEAMTVAVPDGHRLATRRQVALNELANEDFVMPAPTIVGETLRDQALAACLRAGFRPRIVQESSEWRILLGLVSAGLGVALMSSSSRDLKIRGVHYVSIVPRLEMRFAAMYRRGATGKFLAPFLERIERPPGTSVPSGRGPL